MAGYGIVPPGLKSGSGESHALMNSTRSRLLIERRPMASPIGKLPQRRGFGSIEVACNEERPTPSAGVGCVLP